jgi:hypothetical protein
MAAPKAAPMTSGDAISRLVAALTGETPFATTEAGVSWEGSKIVLPALPRHMSYDEGIAWLHRMSEQDNKEIRIYATIDCFPLDGAVAFSKALRRIFGWSSPVPTPGFFGSSPPTAVTVKTGHNTSEQVFWGNFEVPGIDGKLGTDANWGQMKFIVGGVVKQRNAKDVQAIIDLTKKIVAEESIYRGKAFRLIMDSDGNFDKSKEPEFFDTESINPMEMVFSDDLMEQIETNLFAPIENTAACRLHKIPLKRSVLLEGPFGTGKTLCAAVTSKTCVANGWTFISVERVTALRDALLLARLYQPCVVFVEDIDREMEGERTAEMDDILNTVDGVISKGTEIMMVLTSNKAEAINRAMLRPGRLDAVLRIDAPDAEAAEKLMRIYGRGLIPHQESLEQSKEALAGQIPAVIRECVERAKLWAIGRGVTSMALTDGDIVRAARGMKRHLELLQGPAPAESTLEHQVGAALGRLLNHTLANGHDDGFSKDFARLSEQIGDMHRSMSNRNGTGV